MVPAPQLFGRARYEILPFGGIEGEAAAVPGPLTLTVTCSPRTGMDAALDVACRLRRLGHGVVLHMAARMVCGSGHLDALLGRMADAGIADVFLVTGDAERALGPYRSGLDLIGELRTHPNPPRTIGVPGYPEGHPAIEDDALADALRRKAPHADYVTTQICFDPDALVRWIWSMRAGGVELPLYVGVPGAVDRRRLLEISARVGVGSSIRMIRKQRGLRRLVGRPRDATERLLGAVAPLVGGDLGVAGVHFFTFNRLVATTRLADPWLVEKPAHPSPSGGAARDGEPYVPDGIQQEPHTT